MTAPPDEGGENPPPWLDICYEPDGAGGRKRHVGHYILHRDVQPLINEAATDPERGDGLYTELAATEERWLAWRSRVAEALGLVDPGVTVKIVDVPTTMTFGPNGIVWSRADTDKAIAAELRRLADECITSWGELGGRMFDREAASRLRARADELDPPEGT